MIISFSSSIFQSQDDNIQAVLAKILVVLMERNTHFIDLNNMRSSFYDDSGQYIFGSNPICKTYLSSRDQVSLKDFLSKISRINITNLHRQHLVYIVVGTDDSNNEVHPSHLYKIITERSKIIVENGINDWKFICGICQKYSGSRTKRQSIYQLINNAIKDGIIESEHCGGIGEISKITQSHIDSKHYKEIFQYKLMAIFDSDREKVDDLPKHKKKIEYFKNRKISSIVDYGYEPTDLIVWHVLYKKKLENYIPLNVLLSNIDSLTQKQKDDLIPIL